MRELYIFRYLPPKQLDAVRRLFESGNDKVISRVKRQNSNLMDSFRAPGYDQVGSEAIAWLHFYKRNGQEWWLVQVDDRDMFGFKYNGMFRMGFFNPALLRMVEDVVLDVTWTPKSISAIQREHVPCEVHGNRKRCVNYASEMSKDVDV